MNYTSFLNYFKRSDKTVTFGFGAIGIGVVFLFLGFVYSYIMYLIGGVILIFGLVLYFYGNAGRASESDLKEVIKKNLDQIQFPELKEDSKLRKRLPRVVSEEICDGYQFRKDLLIKQQKGGNAVSSEYLCAKIVTLTDAFYIKARVFSFISDEKSEQTLEIPFSSIESIAIERDEQVFTVGKQEITARLCDLVITHDGGRRTVLHRKDDFYADELAKTMNQALRGE
ncbi:MAG: hypothetical protein IJW92_06185 [Clostridia bacterium]|nr:hypothetical protein [Clostridia bacterium]